MLPFRSGTPPPILARWAALLSLWCCGCAATSVEPALEEEGEPLWRRIETEHFVVESNSQSDSRLLRIASEFETLWHAYAAVPILGLRPPKEKPLVVVLRGKDEFRFLAGEGIAGQCFPKSALGPLILMPPHARAFEETVIKHELAHFIASGSLSTAPEWLHEGLAQVMETAEYDVGDGEILFGSHSENLVDGAWYDLPAHLVLRNWPAVMSGEQAHALYGRSWLLVHYLIDYDLRAFLNMLVRIRNGEKWETAWDEELYLRRDAVDEVINRYREREKYGIWRVAAELPDRDKFRFVPVTPADALALRALLHACATSGERELEQKLEAGERDLQAASALDPASERVKRAAAALAEARD